MPVVGRILKAAGQIPVERQSARSADALAAVTQAVTDGRAVIIYPEGTITGDPDLWPMVGKTGAARIALQTGCPVIPVGQWGAQDVMYGNRLHFPKLLPRKTFQLIAGDPVPLDDLRALPVTALDPEGGHHPDDGRDHRAGGRAAGERTAGRTLRSAAGNQEWTGRSGWPDSSG